MIGYKVRRTTLSFEAEKRAFAEHWGKRSRGTREFFYHWVTSMETLFSLLTMKTGAPNVSFGTNPWYRGKRDVYRSIFHVKAEKHPWKRCFATDDEKTSYLVTYSLMSLKSAQATKDRDDSKDYQGLTELQTQMIFHIRWHCFSGRICLYDTARYALRGKCSKPTC